MEFRGVPYYGGPARTKKDAEHLVAHDATLSILGQSEEDSTLLEIIRSKADLFSATQVALDPSCATIHGEEEQSKDATKNVIDSPVQTPATEQCKVKSPSPSPSPSPLPAVPVLMYVPSSFQNLTNPTTMRVFANQSYGVASSEHHFNSPQMLITGPPQNVTTAVGPNQESLALCGLESTQRLSRNQRKKANKRARIAN